MIKAQEFLWRSSGDDAAGFEQDDAGSEEQRFAQIVSDEHDGLAEAAGEGAEFALELRAGDGIERAEGLVHQKKGGISSEGAGNADALALAAGKFAGAAAGKFRWIKSNQGQELPDAHGGAAAVPLLKRGEEADVFGNGEMGEEAGVLDDVPDAAAKANGVPNGGRAILDEDFPFRGK